MAGLEWVVRNGDKSDFFGSVKSPSFSSNVQSNLSTVDNQIPSTVGNPFVPWVIQVSSTGIQMVKEVLSA